jgi:hypothetical protein
MRTVVLALGVGLIVLIAASYGTFYSMLAVGVSDGPGHLTAQIMLAACIVITLAALLAVLCAARAILARL